MIRFVAKLKMCQVMGKEPEAVGSAERELPYCSSNESKRNVGNTKNLIKIVFPDKFDPFLEEFRLKNAQAPCFLAHWPQTAHIV